MAEPTPPPSKDEFFEAQVERALRPYRSWVPANKLSALEEAIRDLLENDPVAAALLQAARPRKAPIKSDDLLVPLATRKDRKDPADGER